MLAIIYYYFLSQSYFLVRSTLHGKVEFIRLKNIAPVDSSLKIVFVNIKTARTIQ